MYVILVDDGQYNAALLIELSKIKRLVKFDVECPLGILLLDGPLSRHKFSKYFEWPNLLIHVYNSFEIEIVPRVLISVGAFKVF